jgi:dolichol-phosphate mannosyltransferase
MDLLMTADAGLSPSVFAFAAAPELTVVVPTLNERENLPLVAAKIADALAGIAWEVIFVDDDSADGTAAVARELGAKDARIRCIRRVGRRGLAGACIEGVLASQARYVAVMDADLQHDEAALAAMLDLLRKGDHDLVIGSRYVAEGSAAGFSRTRHLSSRLAGFMAKVLLGTPVTDPMSGFFMLRREIADQLAPKLATEGFKILADLLSSGRGRLRVAEVPYGFRARQHGESKLDSQVVLDFLGLLAAKATGNAVPVRFVSFLFVGAIGVGVNLVALKLALSASLAFGRAQALATLIAMTSNFFLNNAVTYRDQRLSGLAALRGLIGFYAICAIGALSNIGVATLLYHAAPIWWLAGLVGSVIGAVWNYSLSSTLVWRRS